MRKMYGLVIPSQAIDHCITILLGVSVWVLLSIAGIAIAQTGPITPSGLNTQVNLSPLQPPGKVQYYITGGTRPGGGANLFHSFGEFRVPADNIANFLNGISFNLAGNPLAPGLPTSNILARVTGNFRSDIFGTIQNTGFGLDSPIRRARR